MTLAAVMTYLRCTDEDRGRQLRCSRVFVSVSSSPKAKCLWLSNQIELTLILFYRYFAVLAFRLYIVLGFFLASYSTLLYYGCFLTCYINKI